MAVSSTLKRIAAEKRACQPLQPHQRTAIAAGSYPHLLTPGEFWFLGAMLHLRTLSPRQQARLNEIAIKVERRRR